MLRTRLVTTNSVITDLFFLGKGQTSESVRICLSVYGNKTSVGLGYLAASRIISAKKNKLDWSLVVIAGRGLNLSSCLTE